jgi:hypothetical protein
MVRGVRFWNNRDCYYTQTNNPTEEILRKRSDGNWLVSCGPSAAVTCVAAMGFNARCECPAIMSPRARKS